MASKENIEARGTTRISFDTRAEVDVNGTTIRGNLLDMSLSGIYMRASADVREGEGCEVRILLGDDDPMVIHALGHVARRDDFGFAVAFSGFYLDSISHLQQALLHNAASKGGIEAEMKEQYLSLVSLSHE
ncbi:MAG: PilZ domain-containing protein [Mariprofundaceae bacterium]|nr:PilZ domain-containing protein [Mariprofundaceae bacterium]